MTERATKGLIERAIRAHRATLHESRLVSVVEQELAHIARRHKVSLLQATRSSHPTARRLRKHQRAAIHMQRLRNEVLHRLVGMREGSGIAARAKLLFAGALLDGDSLAAQLVASAAKDARVLTR